MSPFFFTLLLWLGLNTLHAVWLETRRRRWERRFVRTPEGLLPDAAPFSVGSGPVAVLLIHGFADTPRIWARFADRLACRHGLTCRAMRLPGSAEPLRQARRHSLDAWRAAVERELVALSRNHAAIWIAGHSLGAALALDAAVRMPERVTGIVALAPLIRVSRRRSPCLPPIAWFRLARATLAFSPVFESCFSAAGVAVDDPSFSYTRDRFIPFCVYQGLFALERANRDQAPALACPAFVMTSDRDAVVDTAAAWRWFKACPGPVILKTRQDIGHVIPLEIGWQTLTDDIASFIRAHTPGDCKR